ncbi:hypothetical protein [Actinoallomurus sp. NPDC052274]|uniref:hypothetical protein n=1 Tax=Actinoallomurus sp. NPDC052274 TaxID=3155420 RepID=UPI0034212D62
MVEGGRPTSGADGPAHGAGRGWEFTFDLQHAYAAYRGGVEVEIFYTLFRDEGTIIARSKTLRLNVR